jgi:hypothetical protein
MVEALIDSVRNPTFFDWEVKEQVDVIWRFSDRTFYVPEMVEALIDSVRNPTFFRLGG